MNNFVLRMCYERFIDGNPGMSEQSEQNVVNCSETTAGAVDTHKKAPFFQRGPYLVIMNIRLDINNDRFGIIHALAHNKRQRKHVNS